MIYLEIILIAVIIVFQFSLYFYNRKKAETIAYFFPDRKNFSVYQSDIDHDENLPGETYKVDQIAATKAGGAFKLLLEDTNQYLLYNKGNAANFDILKDLCERPYKLQTDIAKANLTTPLYVGLLGTFLGIGLGLIGIVQQGVEEAGIRTLLSGVIIAMVGSFCGLLFTLLSNYVYRQAKEIADERQQAYFSFLQSRLLPRLQQDMASSFNNLRTVLDQFNNDFFQKIIDFKDVFANLSKYVSVQERFLSKLEESGYSQLTESNLRFLEQIRENASLFEAFGGYQRKLNESLELGAGAARDIREVVERLRQIDDVQAYIRQNEEMLRRQVGYLTAHQDKMQDLTQTIQQHFIEAGDEIGKIVQERLQILKREEQDAGEALRLHFERLKQENVYQKITEQLQPIGQMKQEVDEMSRTAQENSRMLLETSEYLVKKFNQDSRVHGSLLGEIQELNRQMSLLNDRRSWWQQLLGKREQDGKRG